MSNLQLIEALCNLVEQMSGVIMSLATELEQCNAQTDADREAISAVRIRYSEILGADEWPDTLEDIFADI